MGRFYPQFAAEPQLPAFALLLQGEIADAPPEPLVRAFLSGLLQTTTDRRVSVVNADAIARELGVHVDAHGERGNSIYASSLRISGGHTSITGTSVSGVARIVEVDGYEIDATPIGAMLITQHHDVPGMIGQVGTLLGQQTSTFRRCKCRAMRSAATPSWSCPSIVRLVRRRSPHYAAFRALTRCVRFRCSHMLERSVCGRIHARLISCIPREPVRG